MTGTIFNLFRPKVFTLTLREGRFDYPDSILTGGFTADAALWLKQHSLFNSTIQISRGRISTQYLEHTESCDDLSYYETSVDERSLSFCREGIKTIFGKIPKRIYFKIIS